MLRHTTSLRRIAARLGARRWDWLACYASGTLVVVFGVLFGREFCAPPATGPASPDTFLASFARWDGTYYRDIARDGYSYHPGEQSTIHFWPIYPLLGSAVAHLTGPASTFGRTGAPPTPTVLNSCSRTAPSTSFPTEPTSTSSLPCGPRPEEKSRKSLEEKSMAGSPVAKDNPPLAARRWFRLAVFGTLLVSCVVGYALYRSIRNAARARSYLDRPLGCVRVPGVEESGFQGPEEERGQPVRWTDGAARLVVPLGDVRPRAITLMLGLLVPQPTRLAVQVNGQSLCDERVEPRDTWVRTWSLEDVPLGGQVAIEILSDVFIPQQTIPGNNDTRTLGVRVWGIVLHSGQQDFLGTPLGGRFVPGVEESGFHGDEEEGGQPYRWTNGAARLVVPIAQQRPASLEAVVEIPTPTLTHLEIAVNGRVLLDTTMTVYRPFSQTLDLRKVDVGDNLTIEVRSSTFVPSRVNPGDKDNRTLGIKVFRLTLLPPP